MDSDRIDNTCDDDESISPPLLHASAFELLARGDLCQGALLGPASGEILYPSRGGAVGERGAR
eukprot:2581879-Pyramimonas_sp.AAC.3